MTGLVALNADCCGSDSAACCQKTLSLGSTSEGSTQPLFCTTACVFAQQMTRVHGHVCTWPRAPATIGGAAARPRRAPDRGAGRAGPGGGERGGGAISEGLAGPRQPPSGPPEGPRRGAIRQRISASTAGSTTRRRSDAGSAQTPTRLSQRPTRPPPPLAAAAAAAASVARWSQ